MITLYDCVTAPSPRRARILLAEKGVAHATVSVDLRANEQLGDNAAIAAYLEARFPEPPLLGVTPLEKAEIARWNGRIEFEGVMAIAEAMRNSAPALKGRALPGPADFEQIPELAQRGLARVKLFFELLNAHLAGRESIATDRFSIADITAVVAVDFARVVRVKPGEQHAHLLRWRATMAARPAMAL